MDLGCRLNGNSWLFANQSSLDVDGIVRKHGLGYGGELGWHSSCYGCQSRFHERQRIFQHDVDQFANQWSVQRRGHYL